MDSLFDEGVVQVVNQPMNVADLWRDCLEDLRFSIGEADMRQWINPLQPKLSKDTLVLHAPNFLWVNLVKETYLNKIKQSVKHCSKGAVSVVRVEQIANANAPSAAKAVDKPTPSATKIAASGALNPAYTFEAFVKGKSNVLAYNACYELSKKDSKHYYGPIFIYGSSGLGKTHLMHAMAHRYQKYGKSICYFDKDLFFNETMKAFRETKIDTYIKKISKADLLIVDDVHMINSKNAPKVSQILMSLFEEFTKGNKQIVLASDRQPSQMKEFDERFLSRFSGGLLLAIEPPDMEMRVQILEKKAQTLEMTLPKDCAIFLAQNLPADVRGLEGALKKVKIHAEFQAVPVDLSLVRDAIKDSMEARARALNAENIRDLVAKYYEVTPKEMMSKKRARHIARPRQMAMALIRELTRDSFPEIGQVFGGRDHTTVMHACEKIDELRQSDPVINKDYQSLKTMLAYV